MPYLKSFGVLVKSFDGDCTKVGGQNDGSCGPGDEVEIN